MTKLVRRSVFETNSSSCHSLSLSRNNELDQFTLELDLEVSEFGWDTGNFNDPQNKFCYLITQLSVDSDYYNESVSYQELHNNLFEESSRYRQILEWLKEEGVEVTIPDADTGWFYVDHGSLGVTDEALESKENLLNYLFSSGSVVTLDYDG